MMNNPDFRLKLNSRKHLIPVAGVRVFDANKGTFRARIFSDYFTYSHEKINVTAQDLQKFARSGFKKSKLFGFLNSTWRFLAPKDREQVFHLPWTSGFIGCFDFLIEVINCLGLWNGYKVTGFMMIQMFVIYYGPFAGNSKGVLLSLFDYFSVKFRALNVSLMCRTFVVVLRGN